MTNKKTTKRALLSSIMALFICFAMLLGTTYAWFAESLTNTNNHIMSGNLLHSANYIGQLAHAAGFDNDPVGIELFNDLLQGLAKVAHQRAANTAGVHLRNVDACILEEAAVNANLTEFVFDENQLLTLITLLDHLLNQSSLACAEKAGVNIDCCHVKTPSVRII